MIEIKTGSNPGDRSDGTFSFQFNSPEGSCTIENIDDPNKDDKETGKLDQFYGDMLGSCETFKPDHILSVQITHTGLDGWRPEYLKISYDSKSFTCKLGKRLEGRASITFPCSCSCV